MADEQHDQAAGDLPANLAGPARRALAAAGYTRLEQLTQISEAELRRLHGMGPKALDQLRRALPPAAAPSPTPSARGTVAEAACLRRSRLRKIAAAPFVSLDGVVELSEQWTIPYFTADMQRVIQQGMAAADTMLMGRRTYEQMAAYWPNLTATEDPFAEFLNTSPKLVVSTTLQSVDWQNSTLITNDVIGEVTRRKQQPGKDILIPGSATWSAACSTRAWSTSCGCCCSRSSWAAASASLTAGLSGCRCGSWSPRRSTAASSRSPTSQHPSEARSAHLKAVVHQDRLAAQGRHDRATSARAAFCLSGT